MSNVLKLVSGEKQSGRDIVLASLNKAIAKIESGELNADSVILIIGAEEGDGHDIMVGFEGLDTMQMIGVLRMAEYQVMAAQCE